MKAVPDTTFSQLESAFRLHKCNVYLIGYVRQSERQLQRIDMSRQEKEIGDTFTLMNLQGKLNCKYTVGYYFSPKAPRANLKEGWPPTPEENKNRLHDAGLPVEKGIPKCSNCNGRFASLCGDTADEISPTELGHTAKSCPQERVEPGSKTEIRCVVCDEIGHRARDCTKPRVDKFACKNCGSVVINPVLGFKLNPAR